ncbi:ROK family protein [Photobacterium lucens]|uniref:ROK family protein n=1 Tax=Photobacterium lucens TaxID=2562949 RepID=UPI0013717131|nr:ROK family protein [Photobacterium lucens]MBP2701932.1 ROK family protein [Vibrio parahaemolyticus]MZG57016.1 ROK family protein [Photobacterium lucens]MZG79238.1 ROK family protein [Photobacterium lucens]
MDRYYWGIDLGGTKIECIVIDRDTEQSVIRERIATESVKGYTHILQQIKTLIDRCADKLGQYPKSVGFGTPGTLDPIHGVMKNCNTTALNGKALDKDLNALLNIKAVLANDANCFALAETHYGVVKRIKPDAQIVFGIIMGTGVGSGIVVDGKCLYGCHGIAGEWGHNVIEAQGADCYCGKQGCVETVISGKGLERYYREISGQDLPLPEIVAAAKNGNANAEKTIARLRHYFSLAVAKIINVIDPEVIVIGGGVGNVDELYQNIDQLILPHLFNSELDTQIVKPELGDSAGVFGAAALVKHL